MTSPLQTLRATFSGIISSLCARVELRALGYNPLPPTIIVPTTAWLFRTLGRFYALVERVQAGRYTPPGPRAKPATARAPRPEPPLTHRRLPTGKSWLIPLVPIDAACAGPQLQHFVAGPDMQALIATAPTIGRILRPLARMLGVDLPATLTLPPRPRPPRPPRTPKSREPRLTHRDIYPVGIRPRFAQNPRDSARRR